ncbi:MAG: tetratricopeptide repeat protein, partial [Bacteroidota bacterium]
MESSNLHRGIQLIQLGRYTDAITYLQNAVADDPTGLDAKYNLAVCYLNLDDFKKASQMANNLMSEMPNNPDLLFLRAQIAQGRNTFDQAMELVTEAISLYPLNADYFG